MAILKMYAADNGFSNTVYYVDDVVLGTTFERDGFKAMMTDIEEGKSWDLGWTNLWTYECCRRKFEQTFVNGRYG